MSVNISGPYPKCGYKDCEGNLVPVTIYDGDIIWKCSKCGRVTKREGGD
jgi:hypothetical protein